MFSRVSRPAGRHARDDRSRREHARERRSLAEELAVTGAADPSAGAGPAARALPEPAGPYDSSQAPPGVARVDLGSLKIPTVPGVEVRVQANQDGAVHQVYLVHGESALQLGVFAAPRSEPIWDEVREEIRRSLFADGVAAEEVAGEYGTELRARVRTAQGLKDLRFVGVNGPRWLARAVYQGPAAVDPVSAAPLAECLRGVVVDRGIDAKPVREPLPLQLSEAMAEQVRDAAAPPGPAAAGGPPPNGSAVVGAMPPGGAAPGVAAAPGGAVPGVAAAPDGSVAGGDPAPPRRRPSPRPRWQE
jgi:hypothetical protein